MAGAGSFLFLLLGLLDLQLGLVGIGHSESIVFRVAVFVDIPYELNFGLGGLDVLQLRVSDVRSEVQHDFLDIFADLRNLLHRILCDLFHFIYLQEGKVRADVQQSDELVVAHLLQSAQLQDFQELESVYFLLPGVACNAFASQN